MLIPPPPISPPLMTAKALLGTLGGKLWTGLIFDQEQGWKWSNGRPYSYMKWDSGRYFLYFHCVDLTLRWIPEQQCQKNKFKNLLLNFMSERTDGCCIHQSQSLSVVELFTTSQNSFNGFIMTVK